VSWKRQHNYLTLVADHQRGKIVWGSDGAGEKAADRFFKELDPEITAAAPPDAEPRESVIGERAAQLRAISLDMGHGYAASARTHAPQAAICIDPYYVVALANQALDEVRRGYWNELRASGDQQAARRFKDARWSLLKKPEKLTDQQAATLARIRAAGGEVWRAYGSKKPPAASSRRASTSTTSKS
jgi:transposase